MEDYKSFTTNKKKAFWRKNPLRGTIHIVIPSLLDFKMYSDNDDTVVKELHWTEYKGWEYTSLVLWKDLLQEVKGGVILDIGAYTGIYSLIAARYCETSPIYAFDIQSNCIERLGKNIEINNCSNIKVTQAACSDNNGTTVFHFYEEEGIISSVAGLVPKKMNNLQKEINAIKLDDFLKDQRADDAVKLIKIDVEGAEQSTLKGMQKILHATKPSVLIEINDAKDIKAVKALFPEGYNIYDINEDKLEVKKLKWYRKPTKFRNYLFTPHDTEALQKIFSGTVK